jgi:hypothetical protein
MLESSVLFTFQSEGFTVNEDIYFDVTLYSQVIVYRSFEGASCLLLQGRRHKVSLIPVFACRG